MEVFISGLPRSIEGNVTASKPQTLEEATNKAQRLMDQIIKHDYVQEINDLKRKLKDKGIIINNNNYQNNYNNNNNRNNDYDQQQKRRQETFETYATANGYTGNRPLCERCTLHHIVSRHGNLHHRFSTSSPSFHDIASPRIGHLALLNLATKLNSTINSVPYLHINSSPTSSFYNPLEQQLSTQEGPKEIQE
ncbi:hypothetical protein Tco_0477350 [Tanacetum coccineum]